MKQSITLVFSGEAGQGLQTIEDFLVNAVSSSHHVFSCSDVMSRVRGGNNTVEIRVSDAPVGAYKDEIDIIFLLNDHSFARLSKRTGKHTVVVGEKDYSNKDGLEGADLTYRAYPFEEMAKEAGGKLFLNTVLFGFAAGMMDLKKEECLKLISDKFEDKGEKVIKQNHSAFNIGFENGIDFVIEEKIAPAGDLKKSYKVLNGTQAVGIGCLGGGCNFVSAYPMSPSTALLEYLANKGVEFDVFVEQAEDEIAALNMVIGAWYAGARAIATTSGGGFSLMEEAMSLSGITETPCVVHIAQRPGPATGLPTRTEQADLFQAVHAGHGEYPKVVLAPGTLEDGVVIGQRAFYLADKYQVPAIILTDQFYLESFGQMKRFELDGKYLDSFVEETEEDYKRYDLSKGPLSPRGIPAQGKGMVKVDSDEHDESGYITEDFSVRVAMHEKRLSKKELILEDYIEPAFIGPDEYNTLIVGWGSTFGVIKEYVESGAHEDMAFLSIKQLYPLDPSIKEYFDRADKVIAIENNASGQLANLLKLELDINADHKILKYNGQPFSIEEIESRVEEVLK
ncbi:2-oxoacid:acceptor oxidoreductase subunit alpha [Alkalibacter saccharofermentans]|uniref:2-oxoglutarate ferredoxin oxidoreductase subunit alpha n=1 Tax=Alkalibacter saccharofermentans DSM 14828 TaxID=1120975 RepID=A0A1M4U7Z4_9FIRM|nr:2-oxoacid:acceptor oxidoreductase subunit alpha [Alkalibacter saccharofermentans]SHE52991.1 2-oxoglutarate ferredoxin oxidoreductase subunit alpha [Alkalibacter saccharofermentans DSM 14828]